MGGGWQRSSLPRHEVPLITSPLDADAANQHSRCHMNPALAPLILEAANAEERAMDDVELRRQLERVHADCFGWAMACCGRDSDDSEEVLQTVYLKVLDGNARYDGQSSFRTWLFGVIRHTTASERG